MTGWARMIQYEVKDKNILASPPKTILKIYEGQMSKGAPSGFGRLILPDFSFVGYLRDWTTTKQGTGIYHKNLMIKYQGIYQAETKFLTTAPQIDTDFPWFY